MQSKIMNIKRDNYPEGYHVIREALVREIRDAQRWSAIMEAWSALSHVRRMGNQMKKEADSFDGDKSDMPPSAGHG